MPLSKNPKKNDGRQNPVTVSTSENLPNGYVPEEQTQENVSPSSTVATGAGVELGIPTIDLTESPPRASRFGRQNGNDEIIEIIDLTHTPPDDDVIFVSEINDVVDIRTPVRLQRRSNSISTVSGQEQINSLTAQASNNTVQRATRRRRSVDDQSSISSLHDPRSPLHSPARFACRICLESTVNQPTSTRCGHVYCQSCIRQAVIFNGLCPICNAPVALRELRRMYL
uniref:RING-type domain-containing protein n=1 Tax=Glossina palpalis gambiensis TaxID=67801 RepID=A0A1B0BKB2_9MUSC